MRTGFLYSLYLFSSFVQGSLLLSAAMLSRMPAPSHARCPHATCHATATDPLLRPHPRPNSKHNQNQPKKHSFLDTGPPACCLQLGQLTSRDHEGCVQLPASPGSSPGSCIQGRLHFKKKNEKVKNKNNPSLERVCKPRGRTLLLAGSLSPTQQSQEPPSKTPVWAMEP